MPPFDALVKALETDFERCIDPGSLVPDAARQMIVNERYGLGHVHDFPKYDGTIGSHWRDAIGEVAA